MHRWLLIVVVGFMVIGSACGLSETPRPATRTPRPTITATFAATEAGTPIPVTEIIGTLIPPTLDASAQVLAGTLTPVETDTPVPTITPTRRPVVARATAVGKLEITNVLLVNVVRNPDQENGAIASVQVVYSGGRGPYTILHDDSLVAGNPFPVLTVCSGTLIHTIKLTSADKQVVTKQYYLTPVVCPP